MTTFEREHQKFFEGSRTRQEERYTGPEATKYWVPKYGEWLSLDEAEYRRIRELARA